eukprot:11257899-Karenia_brevis.AAC.1
MARSTASASGVGARFALGRPSVVKFGGLWLTGCFACNWSRTADVCPRGAPLVKALQAAL